MKELSIKDKAKRYDKAIEIAKSKIKNDKDHVLYESDIIDIFPELYEPEDERIRKAIIEHFAGSHSSMFPYRGFTKEQILAWLEKQGEQKPVEWCSEDEQNLNVCLSYIPHEFLRRWLKDIIHIKYDKPIDKVEPKFKVGDWIVAANNVFRIISLNDELNCYIVVTPNNEEVKIPYYFDNGQGHMCSYHLWTIEDAKDGDVLCVKYGNNEMSFIFTGKQDDVAYCALNSFGEFVLSMVDWLLKTSVLPATKEQRDLLFQKMKEDGYEWDADEKVLNKVIIYEQR